MVSPTHIRYFIVCILRTTLFVGIDDTLISDKKTLNRGKSVSGLLSFYELKIVLVCSSKYAVFAEQFVTLKNMLPAYQSIWREKYCMVPSQKSGPQTQSFIEFLSKNHFKFSLNTLTTQCLTRKIVTSHILLIVTFKYIDNYWMINYLSQAYFTFDLRIYRPKVCY